MQEIHGADEEPAEKKEVEEEAKPDPLTQLITALSRGAQEQQNALPEDDLYTAYAEIMSLVRFMAHFKQIYLIVETRVTL